MFNLTWIFIPQFIINLKHFEFIFAFNFKNYIDINTPLPVKASQFITLRIKLNFDIKVWKLFTQQIKQLIDRFIKEVLKLNFSGLS